MKPSSVLFTRSNLGTVYTFQDCFCAFSELEHWQERYRQLFKLAEKIIPFPEELKRDRYLVDGCESSVWVAHYFNQKDQRHYFVADSDSKIIKGLLVIVLSLTNGQTTDEIKSIQFKSILASLKLGKYLTPSRTNGLVAVMNKIQNYSKDEN